MLRRRAVTVDEQGPVRRRWRLRLAGVLTSVVGLLVAGAVTAAPSQAAYTCFTPKYATWGGAWICKDGSKIRFSMSDTKTDGYCVKMYVGVRYGDGRPWGQYMIGENCSGTWPVWEKTLTVNGQPVYACNATLFRGEYSIYSNYLPVWSQSFPAGVTNNCPRLWS